MNHWSWSGKSTAAIVLLVVLVGFSMTFAVSAIAQPADIVVAADGSEDYTLIQNAVNNASDTSSIEIKSGTYEESVTIGKNVTIEAASGAVISNTSGVTASDGIVIGGNASPEISGITLTGWANAINGYESTGDWKVVNMRMSNVADGVDTSYSSGNWEILNTTIENASENGIVAVGSSGTQVVVDTEIRDSNAGILIKQSTGDWRVKNTIIENIASGGIIASDTSGNWIVTGTNIRNTGNDGIVPYNSSGEWVINSSDIRNSSEDGIDAGKTKKGHIQNVAVTNVARYGIIMAKSDGDWVIEDTTVQQVGQTGIMGELLNTSSDPTIRNLTITNANRGLNFYDANGDWKVVGTKISNVSRDGIISPASSGSPTVANTVIQNTEDGVDFEGATGDWMIQNATIEGTQDDGIDANSTTGDWAVTNSSLTNISGGAVIATQTEGQWQIHESVVTTGDSGGVDAKGATIKGNASFNYWGAADGPNGTIDGTFNGSGGLVRGNITVTPFYSDSSLTTLSSETDNDGDRTDQDSSSGFVDADASDLEGSGTTDDPYVITNASELQAMEDAPNANYRLGSDINATATSNWNNGNGFRPVNSFGGSLDGAGHVVTGLYINRSDDNFVGLISDFDGSGQIANIGLEQANVSGSYATGPVIGTANSNGTVADSYASGTASGSTVGGLAGRVNDNGIIKDSHANTTFSDSDRAGGLVGMTSGNATIRNSYATGTVNGTSLVGGLLGNHNDNASVINSHATGGVYGESKLGGLAGDIEETSSVRGSYATGNVSGESEVGGLAGSILNINNNQNPKISESYATGSVSGDSEIGGLVGSQEQSSRITKSYATGDVSGTTAVGGFVGKQIGGQTIESYAVGSVSGSEFEGGLVGRQVSGEVLDSYWDTEKTGQADSAGNATGLTTNEMSGSSAETNMVGFEFGKTWETRQNDYPNLIGAEMPIPEPQVEVSDARLTPSTVGSAQTHTLAFTASDVSADGNNDTIEISMPNNVAIVSVSGAESTDTNYDVTVVNSDNPIELVVDPDGPAETVQMDIEVTIELSTDEQ